MKEKKKKKVVLTVKANRKGKHVIGFLNFLRIVALPVYYLLRPFRFYGNRKVKDGACVYVINHYSMFDPAFPLATTWEGIHFVVKKELMNKFLIGAVVRGAKSIPVNRDGSDVRAILECFKCLKNNEKIAIYPEGTRNKTDEELLPFKHGAATIAIRAKVPIVPIVIYKKPRLFRCAHILIGEPFEFSEYYDRKLSEEELSQADERLRQMMLDMKAAHTEYLQSKKKKKA
ncbi:MAG: 1-acyl-sn-glycerol-3-phosphate acyltransferase [Clostridiales bacterium]|nr:1-acyl-sn-glycerol-3-phosphate acyltransferase [Clostridiales bacterium]